MVTQAHLGGYPLLASTVVEWGQTEGVRPYEATFDMVPRMAQELQKKGSRVDLVMHGGKTFKNLWVLGIVPRDNPHIMGIRVADRRWLLNRRHILRRYNMRRNVGHKRAGRNDQPVLNDVSPDVWYWGWSLKEENGVPPGAKWQPPQVLRDILDAIEEYEKSVGGGGGYTIRPEVNKTNRTLPVESLVIDDKGDMAINRAVGLVPEAGFTVDPDGRYVVYSKVSGKELVAQKALGPEIVGGGHLAVVDNSLECPSEVEVLFTIESEVRFDFQDLTGNVTAESRFMDNRIAVPDYVLADGGNDLVQGTWANIDRVMRLWGAGPAGSGITAVTQKLVQRASLPFMDLWAALMLTGVRNPDQDWAGRVGALMTHWRKTFGLSSFWVDRFLAIKPYRVGIIDPENGINAPAEAYCDHSFLGTQRSFFKQLQGNADLRYAINVTGYPTGPALQGVSAAGTKAFNSISKPSPARVSIIDPDQGIIQVQFKSDENHMFEAAMPGLVVREDGQPYIPAGVFDNPRKTSPTFDSISEANQIPRLSDDWKLAVILTAVPASPNDERQLFKITVKPEDVKDILPSAAAASVGKARGPKWQVRIQPGTDGARALVRWLDSRSSDIEAIFGIGDKEPNLDGLILNGDLGKVKGNGPQAPSLNMIALAVSASIFARFTDRLEGQATGMMNAKLQLDGFMQAIYHRVQTTGEATSTIQMSQIPPDLDMLAMLDNGTRALLTRQPHPEK